MTVEEKERTIKEGEERKGGRTIEGDEDRRRISAPITARVCVCVPAPS
jgi:hypothetical protein